MELREEQDQDHDAVRQLVRHAFGSHGDVVADLVDTLRAGPVSLSLVAEEEGVLVGHLMFSTSLLDAPPRLVDVQVLSPLAVTPDRQRQGIGLALVRQGLRVLDARGVPLVFLEGHPAYYPQAGFEPAGAHGFRKPSLRIPDAAFQVVRLAGYQSWMTGTLVYPSAFWEHDSVGLRDTGTGQH